MKTVAFLFPGQGSQYVGMGKNLYDNFEVARNTFEEANENLGFDLRSLCFEGSMEELTKTFNTQPAILTASVAAFRVYMQEIGIIPEYTAGHSLGEISALCCAGAIKFQDAVRIVRERGILMQEAVPSGLGSMAAVGGVDTGIIEEECINASRKDKFVVISNYNSSDQLVISGHSEAVAAAGEVLKAKGARVIPLRVSAPFHSPLMQRAADRFREELNKYSFGEPMWPVVSNVTSEPYPKGEIIKYLTNQMVKPVKWQSLIKYIMSMGVDIALEFGPQAVLKNLMKKNAPSILTCCCENVEDIKIFKKKLSENHKENVIFIDKCISTITKCIKIAVTTKNRNWDNTEYGKGAVEVYRRLVELKEKLVNKEDTPGIEHVREGVGLLRKILDTKKVPADETSKRIDQLFEEDGLKAILEE